MFDRTFALLFRAIDRIRTQLEYADPELRSYLAEELMSLQGFTEQYMDHWMALDEQIQELFETYDLMESIGAPISSGSLVIGTSEDVAGKIKSVPSERIDLSSSLGEQDHDMSFEQAVFFEPQPVSLSFRKAMGYFDLLMFPQAANFFEKALTFEEDPIARVYLAATYLADGQLDLAMDQTHLVRANTDEPLIVAASNEVEAQIHFERGDLNRARMCLESITTSKPDLEDSWYNLAIVRAHQGDVQGAMTALTQSLELNPQDTESAYLLGLLQLQEGQIRDSLATVSAGLCYDPRNPLLLSLQAAIFMDSGDLDTATRQWKRIVQSRPDFRSAWSQLAWCKIQEGNLPEAVSILKKSICLDPGHHEAMVQLGIALMLQGDLVAAEENLLDSIGHCHEKSWVWIALGRISTLRGDLKEAYVRLGRALRDERKAVKRLALYSYGQALYSEERYAESEKYLKASLCLGQPNAAILIALGRVSERLGRPHEADRYFARAETVVPRARSQRGSRQQGADAISASSRASGESRN